MSGSDTTTTTPSSGGQKLPPPGTYTYDTSGSYTIGGGSPTSYPSSSQIVVAVSGCGETATWKVPDGSTTVYECPVSGGLLVKYESSTVTYLGFTVTQKFNCAPDSFVPVTTGTPSEHWHFRCTSPSSSNGGSTTAENTVTLIGSQTMPVGSQSVSTEHVRVVSQFSGQESGTATTDYWFTSDAGVVKETGNIDASRGGVTYTSNFKLALTSLSPSS